MVRMNTPWGSGMVLLVAGALAAGPAAIAREADRAHPADDSPPHSIHLPLAVSAARLEDSIAPVVFTPAPTRIPTDEPTPTEFPTETATPSPSPPAPTPVVCKPLAQRVRIVTTDVGAPMRGNDEYFPIVVAPRADGGSLVAWRDQQPLTVQVASFDQNGKMSAKPLSFPAEEVHALVAQEDGGAMAVVENDPDIYSPKYCRGASTPDKSYCAKMDLWRFDASGKTKWRTTLTNKVNVDHDGAAFIWWYQHTARLVWTGSEYGLYFRSASSSPRPGVAGEIDVHAGDTFKFVDGDGGVLTDKWSWGCSHSWALRLAFNGHFGSACHGDAYPNAFHAVVLDRQKRLGEAKLRENLDPTKRALGGMVATPTGFWLNYMADVGGVMELHLAFIDNTGRVTQDNALTAAKNLETRYPFRAYLAAYGSDEMLAGWMSGGKLQLAVLDRANGKVLDGPVATDAKIDKWVEFVAFPNGDAGWAWSPGGSVKLDMVRVSGCQ